MQISEAEVQWKSDGGGWKSTRARHSHTGIHVAPLRCFDHY